MKPAYWVESEQAGGKWLGLSMWETQAGAEAAMERLAEYQRTRRYRVVCGKAIVARANFPEVATNAQGDSRQTVR